MFGFGDIKVKKKNVDLTLSELVDKYVDSNYVNITYSPLGSASVWISPKDNNKEDNKEDDKEDDK